jgi:hypothetical protein
MGIYDSVLNVLTCISLTLNLHACMIKRSLETELAWAIVIVPPETKDPFAA